MRDRRDQIEIPSAHESERFVLASILQNPDSYPHLAKRLSLDDFDNQRNRKIFLRMGELYARGLPVDTPTLGEEMAHHKELGKDGWTYLANLDTGMPSVFNVDGYIRILQQKTALRQIIFIGDHLMKSATTANGNTQEVIKTVEQMLSDLIERRGIESDDRIHSLHELSPLDDVEEQIKYLDRPVLPQGALVAVSGNSGHGKTTFMCAAARDLCAAGTPCVILDRENPRPLVAKRFRELGISLAAGNHPLYWGIWERELPPMPDDPRILEWVKMANRPALVIIDSKTSYLAGANENDSAPNSAFFARCRRLTAAGATVAVLINSSDKGDSADYRGHSIIKDLVDHAVRVSNFDPESLGLLHTLTVKPFKSRFGDWSELKAQYAGGKMIRSADPLQVTRTITEQLRALLAKNPGVLKSRFFELAVAEKLRDRAAREFVELGLQEGSIRETTGRHNAKSLYLAADFPQEHLAQSE